MTKMLSPNAPATGRVAGVRFTPIDTGTLTPVHSASTCRSMSRASTTADPAGPTRSMRTADTLYSGIFDSGSSAGWSAGWPPGGPPSGRG